jgi:hypothetical protein
VTKANTFTVSVPASFPLGGTVQLTIRVSFAGALSPQSATKSITVGQPGQAQDFSYAEPAVAIPDGDDDGVDVPLAVSGVGKVARATFSVDGTSCSPAVHRRWSGSTTRSSVTWSARWRPRTAPR